MTLKEEKALENRLRRLAKKKGYYIKKSRAKNWNIDDQQGYMIIKLHFNTIAAGEKFNLSLEEVEVFFNEDI